jgi:prepilin-type N-terminal cleavage/methylation domain-containing protein
MRSASRGFTLIELLLAVGIICVLAGLALPGLFRARVASNEASAIGSLRAVNSAESTYAASCGRSGFAQSLDDLARPPSGSSQGFISPDLARNGVVKSGYQINLALDVSAVPVASASRTCNAAASDSVSSYFVETHPVMPGATGVRSFASSSQGAIYFNPTGATLAAGMAGGTPLQ